MARPKKLHEDTKTYNLTIPIILFDRLEKISKIETENDIRHISIAELIRDLGEELDFEIVEDVDG